MNNIQNDFLNALVSSGIAVVTTIGFFLVAILKNSYLQESVSSFFANRLNKYVIDKKDLRTHELFLKTRDLIKKQYYCSDLANPLKLDLFNDYMCILGKIVYDEMIKILELDLDKVTISEMKNLLHETTINIFIKVDNEFKNILRQKNNNEKEITIVLNRIREWRNDYQDIINENMLLVFATAKINNNQYLLDKAFAVLTIGLDFLVKNGIDSFNKLNGQLDNFLNGNKTI